MSASLWDLFVASAGRDAAMIADAADLDPRMGHIAFRIGLSSLGIGAEPVGRLALAVERGLDRAAALDENGKAALREAIATLREAFHQLANPDKSGARVEDLPLAERMAAVDAAIGGATAAPSLPVITIPPIETAATVATTAAPPANAFAWTPAVDD